MKKVFFGFKKRRVDCSQLIHCCEVAQLSGDDSRESVVAQVSTRKRKSCCITAWWARKRWLTDNWVTKVRWPSSDGMVPESWLFISNLFTKLRKPIFSCFHVEYRGLTYSEINEVSCPNSVGIVLPNGFPFRDLLTRGSKFCDFGLWNR